LAGRPAYIGRFAPSPTGPLHAGSLVAALASWLDARAHGGQWLLRHEDLDTPRCVPGAMAHIEAQLAACGLVPDATPRCQSLDTHRYQQALDSLLSRGQAYRCHCSRKAIAQALAAAGRPPQRHQGQIYPGTCRPVRGQSISARAGGAVRFGLPAALDQSLHWHDRRLGLQQQDVAREVGDFVLLRADGLWSYQLAVVVDDADQGISHVVRGQDLADNTARQILLQQDLDLPRPQYLHTPLVWAADGQKLSKQTGAAALVVGQPGQALQALRAAARVLDLPEALPLQPHPALADWLAAAVVAWGERWAKLA
jgi:glutamyl-Q tRNA(Asp) synthetase